MLAKFNTLLKELRERRIIQNLFFYAIGAIGVLASVYEISSVEKMRRVFLILCIIGIPTVLIVSFFHGKGGRNPITKMEVLLITLCVLTGGSILVKTIIEPRPMTILIRMMEPNERWFIENIIKKFEQENHCKVTIKEFRNDYEIIEILKSEREERRTGNISLVKATMPLTLILYKERFVRSFEDVLIDLKLSKPEIESWLHKIEDEYDPVALKMCSFNTITGRELFFLPRKLETRMMIYRKSKVADAVKNWHKFKAEINDIVKKENGYGLPRNFNLEPDANKWDYYDTLVVGYYWANNEYNGHKTARIAHRSKDYEGTIIGLIDRALQLGAHEQDIRDMYKFSKAIIDMFHWEAIFRKYNLYYKGMWEEDGWSGSNIYDGIKKDCVYLAWMHQLDCLLIHGSKELGIEGYLNDKEDLGLAIMPLGISFELTKDGLPKRTGTREAHTSGWFWGIPKNSPAPELAYRLAMFITSYMPHLNECKDFLLIPVRKDVNDVLKVDLKSSWKNNVYTKSQEQLRINGENFAPRFKTLMDYQEFLHEYYNAFEEIVIKRRYSQEGPKGKVDRNFIREYLR